MRSLTCRERFCGEEMCFFMERPRDPGAVAVPRAVGGSLPQEIQQLTIYGVEQGENGLHKS